MNMDNKDKSNGFWAFIRRIPQDALEEAAAGNLSGAIFAIFILIVPCVIFLAPVYFYQQITTSFDPKDLLARFFGVGLGICAGSLCSILFLIILGIINCLFSHNDNANQQTSNNKDEEVLEESPAPSVEKIKKTSHSLLYNVFIHILFALFWVFLSALSAVVVGFFVGYCWDVSYASSSSIKHQLLIYELPVIIVYLIAFHIWYLRKSASAPLSEYHSNVRFFTGIFFILLPLFLTAIGTGKLCKPSIPYKDQELESGVYLYTNDTAYNVTGVNIYSSRCGGFSHSGFCLITKDPRGENAQWKKFDLKALSLKALRHNDLRFTKLQRGYYVNMLSMAVPDQDGFTNYQSRCYPQENAYDFDTDALKNYLNGHSPNDLPAPALRMKKLSTDDYRKTWNRVVEFGKQFDKQFPNGMVYSPVPYTDKNVKTINCNTFSGSVLNTLIKEKLINSNGKQTVKEFEKLINPRFSFGGQTMADGQKLNEFFAQDDAAEQVERHWEFVKTAPLSEQNFWANALRPDGRYGKSLSKLVEKPED